MESKPENDAWNEGRQAYEKANAIDDGCRRLDLEMG